jgi:hypothetical protein
MQIFSSYEELTNAPEEVRDYVKTLEEGGGFRMFGKNSGGSIFLIEGDEELDEISVYDPSDELYEEGTITQTSGRFDFADYSPNGKYAILYSLLNDEDGLVYVIPREIADECPNIQESIDLSP